MTARAIALSPAGQAAVDAALAGFGGPALHETTPAEARAQLEARRAGRPPFRDGRVGIADDGSGPLAVRRYRPGGHSGEAAIVYCHGGGWVMGRPDDFDAACAALAAATGWPVVSPDYRLAPEHPYPAAMEDIVAVVRAERAQGRMVRLVGESAGGGLALSAAMACRDRDLPVAALLLFYPLTTYAAAAGADRSRDTPLLQAADLPWCWGHYLADAGRRGPYAAPGSDGGLAGLPPTLLIQGSRDPVAPTAAAFCDRLRAAGVEVDEWICEGLPHAFTALRALAPVTAIIDEAAAWLKGRGPPARW